MKSLMSARTMRNLSKTIIAYSNGEPVFKGSLQDFLFMSLQEKRELKVTSFCFCTKGEN